VARLQPHARAPSGGVDWHSIAGDHSVRAALLSLLLAGATLGAQEPAYKNPQLPVSERVKDLLGRMTLEEKFWQLYMIPGAVGDSGHDYSRGIFGLQDRGARNAAEDARRHDAMQRYFVDSTRLGIPMLPFEEAVHGLMRRGATVFPAAIALAATFDSTLVRDVAARIARQARQRGIRQVLSPVINIANDVRWGRVEETYGEDTYLSGVMGRAFVRAMERSGVIATPKHFVANVGEGGRDSYPIDVSLRVLMETHFPPFKSAIRDAGARSIMTSYNSVDGSPASQNAALLNGTLKRDWGFGGFVISDQAAVGGATVLHFTEPNTPTATKHAIESGLDVIFQSSWPQHRNYLAAFQRGLVAPEAIESAVARVLRAKFELGLFENPYATPDSGQYNDGYAAEEAARKSLVLLKNTGVLPLRRAPLSIGVIGVDAAIPRLGGYTLDSVAATSIEQALRMRLQRTTTVRYAPGTGRGPVRMSSDPEGARNDTLETIPADAFAVLRGEYWPNNRFEGQPTLDRPEDRIDFRWTLSPPGREIPFDWFSARFTGRLMVPSSGVRRLAIEGNDGYRLSLDGRVIIDNWRKQSFRTTTAAVSLRPGSVHAIQLDYFESTGNARLKLQWDARADTMDHFRRAVSLASLSDVTIIVAGVEEGEFRDRASLALPGRQEELILRVAEAAAGKPVIVVIIGGSAVTMNRWIDKVGAVLYAWYPGQSGANAIIDAVFGMQNPAGRLPITFPISEGQLPLTYNHKPTGRGDDYVDLTGMPAFPFGFGLSYTTFEYSGLTLAPAEMPADGMTTVRFKVKNTGAVAGDEVPQLYVRDVLASVARPVMELKGFTRIHLKPGEEREVALILRAKDLEFLDATMRWVVEPGTWRIMVGASSKDIRLRGALVVR
jgi:beta-glucosidase